MNKNFMPRLRKAIIKPGSMTVDGDVPDPIIYNRWLDVEDYDRHTITVRCYDYKMYQYTFARSEILDMK